MAGRACSTELKTLDERKAWTRALYEAGYLAMGWPKECGGRDARPLEQAIVADEIALANVPRGLLGLGINIVGPTLVHHGTPEQKARFLPKLLAAEEIWCQLFSEPNSGSDLASLRTRAEDNGSHYEINGQKM